MKKSDIIRAWKDEAFRKTLSAEQLAEMPANPAGELTAEMQEMVVGGNPGTARSKIIQTHSCGGIVCNEH